MTCLSGPQMSSHLSRFVFDMTPPEIESFVEKIVATNLPRASSALGGRWCVGLSHRCKSVLLSPSEVATDGYVGQTHVATVPRRWQNTPRTAGHANPHKKQNGKLPNHFAHRRRKKQHAHSSTAQIYVSKLESLLRFHARLRIAME